jgi:putative tricarboxylic transport membrane protein
MMRAWIAVPFSLLLAAPGAWAQAFKPNRPVEIVVHNAPGGGSDLLARFISQVIEKEKILPVRTTVNNRPGGGSALAMAYMVERKGEPHTIALFTTAWMMTPLLSQEATAGFYDMTPVARLVLEPALILVKGDSPYRSVKDFIEAAKKEPGKLKQAGGSVQTRGNFVRLTLQRHTDSRWVYISFPGGGERNAALLGGHVQLLVAEPAEASEYVRNGSMRVLAQITDKRLAAFPNVPTLREAGYNIHSDPTIRGVVSPPGTARPVVLYWEEVFARLVKTEAWHKYLEENQFEDGFQRGDELAKSSQEYVARMREVLKDAGLKVYR